MDGLALVSVCIPLYNGEKFLDEAFHCVLKQTYKNLEIIVSNNCSTDRSIEIIESYKDPRIKIFNNETNIGALNNFRKVFTYATGKYITFLGADDAMELDTIEKAISIFENEAYKDVVLVNSHIEIINDESKHVYTKKYFFGSGLMSSYWGIRSNLLYGSNLIGEPNGSVFKKEAYDKIPEPKLKNGNTWTLDLELKMELLLIGKGYMIPEPLGKFRISKQSTSNKELKFVQAKLFRELTYNLYKDKRYHLSFFWVITASINSFLLQLVRNIFYKLFIKNK